MEEEPTTSGGPHGLQAGSRFGHYRLNRLLGKGGFGHVWEAEDTVMDRVVALKLLRSDYSENEKFRQRLFREARAAGRLHEAHVVPIHHCGEIDGQLYIDMRLISGTDLEAVLSREGPLDLARAVSAVRQIAAALDAAHNAGLIHRDVKPANILLADHDFAYLVDFGLANAASDAKLTTTGFTVGTFAYMAPERFSAGAEKDHRVDVYALACVLYEMLTGSPPYSGDSPALMSAHLTAPIPRASQQHPGIPIALDDVIACGMAKAPADRYATTIELANAARDAIGVTVPEPTTSLPATEQAPLPPKQAGNRVTAQPQMSTAESLVSAKPASPRRTPPTPTKDGETRRRTKVALIVGAVVILAAVVVPLYAVFKHQSPQTSPLVASSALPGLLLSPDQIAAVNGATGLKVTGTWQTIQDHSADVPNLGCLALYYPGEKAVYSDSGWTNVEIQQLEEHDSRSNGYKYYVIQAAVLFPAASQTLAFFTTSAQQWSSCSNRQIANTLGATDVVYDVGPLSNNDRTLSITAFQENSHGWACQRALTRANNVAIDIKACSYSPANSAVAIAEQIAAKVPLASKNQDTVASSTASGNSPTSAVTTSRPPRPQRVRPPPMIGTSLHAETAALQ